MAGKFQSLWHCYWWRAYELALGSQFLDGGTLSSIWIVEEVTISLQKEITHFHLSGKCCVNLVSFQTCSVLGFLRNFSFSAILIFSYKAFLACHQQCELVRKQLFSLFQRKKQWLQVWYLLVRMISSQPIKELSFTLDWWFSEKNWFLILNRGSKKSKHQGQRYYPKSPVLSFMKIASSLEFL
jgi:hypothetical protein